MRILLAVVLTGCSGLEPSIGHLYVEQPSTGGTVDMPDSEPAITSDAATEAMPEDGDAQPATHADAHADADARPTMPTGVSFRRDIRPMINRAASDPMGRGCKNCHFSTEANRRGIDLGGFDMATLGAIREGGGSTGRRIIVAGKPEESGLIQKLRGNYPYGTRMPKNGPAFWSDADVKIVADWIAEGAKGADDE